MDSANNLLFGPKLPEILSGWVSISGIKLH